MRYVVTQARLEHAQPPRHADGPAVAVGQADHAAAALVDGASASREQDQAEQAEIADDHAAGDTFEHLLLRRGTNLSLRQILYPPVGVVVVGHHAAPALIDSEHRQRWDQYGGGEQERCRAPEERLHPEPEIKPDAAMHPGDHEHREHLPQPRRSHDKEQVKFLRIEFFVIEQSLAHAHADDMGDDQQRDAQAKQKLQRFDRLPAEFAALVQRPDPEPGVHQAGSVEHDGDGKELPERRMDIDAARQRLHRDVAERMVEEMADQIGEQHHAADKPHLPQADAADGVCQSFTRKGRHVIHDRRL
jgi:hypothetical protein